MKKLVLLLLIAAPMCAQTPPGAYGPGNSGSISPSQLPTGVQKANTISATDYGVKADTQWAVDATFTNASGAVVLTSGDPQFVSTDVGKVCFGTNYAGGTGNYTAYVLRISAGTISTVTDGTHATCSTNSNANCSAVCTFVWGSDDTAALTAAWNAAANISGNYNCKTLILPTGGMLTTTGQFNSALCSQKIVVTGDKPISIWGQGIRSTYIIPVGGNFNFSHSTSCNGVGGSLTNSCFMGINGLSWNNLSISGFGWCNTSGSSVASTAIAYIGTDGYPANIDIDFFGCSDGNVFGYGTSTGGTISYNINGNGAGSTGIVFASSTAHETMASFFCCSVNSAAQLQNSATWEDYGSGYQGIGCGAAVLNLNSTSGIVNFYNTRFGGSCSSGNLSIVSMASSVVVNQFGGGCTALPVSGNSTCYSVGSGTTLFAQNARFFGAGTGFSLSVPSGGTFVDQGGNFWSGTNTSLPGTYIADGHGVKGSCTGVGTASQTLGLYNTGPNVTATTCTSTTIGTGFPVTGVRTLRNLVVKASAAGTNASSGVVTVLVNGNASTITCTIGTATSCFDGQHTVTTADGDLISIRFTTQAADTLAGVNAVVGWN